MLLDILPFDFEVVECLDAQNIAFECPDYEHNLMFLIFEGCLMMINILVKVI